MIGSTISNRYQVLEPLGEGGMATVYRAMDTRLNREVALKFIRFERLDSKKAIKRFQREAQALAQLSHPNIVGIHDFGDHEDTPFLVMEYLAGGTLKDLLGKAMPWQRAISLVLPIANALDYAHKQKIIHRDIKPSNILRKNDDTLMLADFGIAKVLESDESTELTGTGMGIGTPEYMSPEQGLGEELDERTDLYSLAVILYELVTGSKPFQANTPMAVVVKHINEPISKPRSLNRTIPRRLEKIILRALEKDRKKRYQNVAAFAKALEKTRTKSRTSLADQWRTVRAQRRDRKNSEKEKRIPQTASALQEDVEPTHDVKKPAHPASPSKHQGQRVRSLGLTRARKNRLSPLRRYLAFGLGLATLLFLLFLGFRQFAENDNSVEATVLGDAEIWLASPTIVPSNTPARTLELETPSGALVASGESVPFIQMDGLEKISQENVDQLQLLSELQLSSFIDMAWGPDSGVLVLALEGVIQVMDVSNNAILDEIRFDSIVTDIDSASKGDVLAIGLNDGTVQIYSIVEMSYVTTIQLDTNGKVISVSLSEDGNYLATSSSNGVVSFWELSTGDELRRIEVSLGGDQMTMSPDGKYFAANTDVWVSVWQFAGGILLHDDLNQMPFAELQSPTFEEFVFSPDSSILAVAYDDNVTKLWQMTTGLLLKELGGHTDKVTTISFSQSGDLMATGSNDKRFIVWDLGEISDQATDMMSINLGGSFVNRGISFSPNGNLIATIISQGSLTAGSTARKLQIWGVWNKNNEIVLTAEPQAGVTSGAEGQDANEQLSEPSEPQVLTKSEYFEGVEVRAYDSFDDPTLSNNWEVTEWLGEYYSVQNGQINLTDNTREGYWGSLARINALQNNRAVITEFSINSKNDVFEIILINAESNENLPGSHGFGLHWGIQYSQENGLTSKLYNDSAEVEENFLKGALADLVPGTRYVLLLEPAGAGKMIARIWQKDNPDNRAVAVMIMNQDWDNQYWRFDAVVKQGAINLFHYEVLPADELPQSTVIFGLWVYDGLSDGGEGQEVVAHTTEGDQVEVLDFGSNEWGQKYVQIYLYDLNLFAWATEEHIDLGYR